MDMITVSFEKLKKIVKVLEDKGMKKDDQVSFEFIVGSLFPYILDNIKKEMQKQHALGYAEGLNASKEKKELVN